MGEYYYVYGFMPALSEKERPKLKGMDGSSPVMFHQYEDISAAYSPVSSDVFSEEQLQKNVEDMEWLKDHAFHHHQVMNELQSHAVIIPLSFGTVYESIENLEAALAAYSEEMKHLFNELKGKEEWSVKVYVKRSLFDDDFSKNEEEIKQRKEEIAQMSKGKQFFALKKLDAWLKERADEEIDRLCRELHEDLVKLTSDFLKKKVWDQKISGREEEMVSNAVYLFKDSEAVNQGIQKVKEFQENAEKNYNGLLVEATGPWPSYHFAKLQEPEQKQ
ncbi:GvpL/GvpF family gas vesicle protein [Alkalicoccus halolimnae]|uniref:GvpL/GvpF family gas vesicle protein n=1 Tax=Alkalicoccus halolimnae TaxID=1667239 RepID=A0A5C7FFW7_9BACI|nr:GvpL/GvpF family gas vesicle protein [Alkalicoccus halolimnae]TXF85134.1 GvpL/GvpF family gas vesicle protein [Alkalicoccus halolimnae]